MARYLKIKDKITAELISFRPNLAQLRVWNTAKLQIDRDLPVRLLVAKARQEGVSTFAEALLFQYINRYPNKLAQVVSADTDSTDLVFSMSKIFQEMMPDGVKRRTLHSNRKEIAYASPHRSKLMVQTAGKDVLGRGGTVHYSHDSEVAFWPNAKEGLGGALQQVPKAPGTVVILESTGNGVGGEFYDRYVAAVDKRKYAPDDYSGFLPIFLAWWSFPDYQEALPKDGIELYRDHELYGDEVALADRFKLTKEQLYWRRLTIKGECGGDIRLFKQEYPADWQECFQATGQSVFSQGMLNRWQDRSVVGRPVLFDSNEPYDVLRQDECWRIYETRDPVADYTMGIDTAEGRVSDSKNARSNPDYHGVVVYNRTRNSIAATYHGRCDQHELGHQCIGAGGYYNTAWVAPELPYGMVVLDMFKQAKYPHIFQRQTADDREDVDEMDNLGWKTTVATRPMMVEGLLKLINETNPLCPSPEIIGEMRTFIRDKSGKATHLPGEHDDLLFGWMIAVQLHNRCPLKEQPYPYSTTGELPDRTTGRDICYSGAIDYGIDFDGEDDDLFE